MPTIPQGYYASMFSLKNLQQYIVLFVMGLCILGGTLGYQVVRWSLIGRSWPVVQAGIDSTVSCKGVSRRPQMTCSYLLEYVYEGQTYYQRASLSRVEYEGRLSALEPGDRTESVKVLIKVDPKNPERMIVFPQLGEVMKGWLLVAGIGFIFVMIIIYLKQRLNRGSTSV